LHFSHILNQFLVSFLIRDEFRMSFYHLNLHEIV
jgi:hypothetical protein